jgi:peptidoglycan/LPS O-acetylase OafA/YrhL
LVPALALLLAFFAAFALSGRFPWTPIVLAATYTTNLAPVLGLGTGALGHTWSLSLEEQFYALWPLLVLPATRSRHGLKVLVAAIIASTALRVVLVHDHASGIAFGFRPDTRVDALLVGCVLAIVVTRMERWSALAGWAAAATVVFVVGMTFTGWRQSAVALLPMSLAGAMVVGWAATSSASWPLRVLGRGPLAWTGRISYAMYLWQSPVIVSLAGASLTVRTLVALPVVYSIAAISWVVVERPFQRRHGRAGGVQSPDTSLAGFPVAVTSADHVPGDGVGAR